MGGPNGEVTVEIPTRNGSTISVTLGEEDFIIDAARGQPEPLLDAAISVVGAGIRAAASHPIDVNVAWWYAAARKGAFNAWSARPQQNAEWLAMIFRDNSLAMRNAADIRIAVQMLLLYYETDTRTKLLWQLAGRQVAGSILSYQVYSFGGRLAPNLASKAALGAHNFFASMAGAAVRACIAVAENSNPNDRMGHVLGPHFLLNALMTGDDTYFNLPQMLGPEVFYRLQQHLRAHPEAIKIDDWELARINATVNWLVDAFFVNPDAALNNTPAMPQEAGP